MTAPINPPFRAEHIGSLLRPAPLLAIRSDHAAGKISDEEVRRAEDDAIEQAIALQLELGLSSITDGEYRRHAYSDSFTVDVFTGVKIGSTEDRNWTYSDAQGQKTEGRVPIVVDRLEWPGPVNVDDFEFVKRNAGAGTPKVTLPGPCYIHFRSGRDNISTDIYPDLDAFWQDLVEAYIKEIEALYAAGCRYIQLDETSIAKFGDPKIREGLERRGDRWDDLLEIYTDVINEIARRTPTDLSLGIHLCRGNKGGSWQAATGYDDVAAKLFRKLEIQFYFLEYDSPRAGGFEPLREVPDNKTVILGLVSTKASALEQVDSVKQRLEAAAQYVDMDRLGISPQCGFASLDSGNPISFDDQAAKVRLVVDLAREYWGYTPAAQA
ncbi:MAG: 5-methyltetrahydropteroyltriglutamate--homocysteine S-methyltransferase [Alphaproteobacteria bacterium]